MKLILTMMITALLSACAVNDFGRQGDIFNTRQVFDRHEKNLNLQPN